MGFHLANANWVATVKNAKISNTECEKMLNIIDPIIKISLHLMTYQEN